jgi:hypothetical protein
MTDYYSPKRETTKGHKGEEKAKKGKETKPSAVFSDINR